MPIEKNKISNNLDIEEELSELKPSRRKTAADAVGVYILSEIKSYLDKGNSPVKGEGAFKKLTKDYKKYKQKLGKGGDPNLQLFGDIVNSIQVNATKRSVELKIANSLQKKKAYNHNVGDTLPKRQFIPEEDNQFKRNITSGIKKVIEEFKDGDEG